MKPKRNPQQPLFDDIEQHEKPKEPLFDDVEIKAKADASLSRKGCFAMILIVCGVLACAQIISEHTPPQASTELSNVDISLMLWAGVFGLFLLFVGIRVYLSKHGWPNSNYVRSRKRKPKLDD